MPNEVILSTTGEQFTLTRDKLHDGHGRIRNYRSIDRSVLIEVFAKISSLLIPNSKNNIIVEQMAANTVITVRKVRGYSQENTRRVANRRWNVSYSGERAVCIGCKRFTGTSSQALRRWAKSAV